MDHRHKGSARIGFAGDIGPLGPGERKAPPIVRRRPGFGESLSGSLGETFGGPLGARLRRGFVSPPAHAAAAGAAEGLFGRDFWPAGAPHPLLRLAGGLVCAPLAVLLPTFLLALLVYQLGENDSAAAWSMTYEAGYDLFATLYAPLLLGGGVGFAALWALRLRSRRGFALIGGALGAIGALLVYMIDGALPAVAAGYAMFAGALSMLALRWIAGIRKLDDASQTD